MTWETYLAKNNTPTTDPQHEHNCSNCLWLGTFGEFDLWHHPRHDWDDHGEDTIIARFGTDGEYSSGWCFARSIEPLWEAYRRMYLDGCIDHFTHAERNPALEFAFAMDFKPLHYIETSFGRGKVTYIAKKAVQVLEVFDSLPKAIEYIQSL